MTVFGPDFVGRAMVAPVRPTGMHRVSASEIVVSVREPEKAARVQERGIHVRRGDVERPLTRRLFLHVLVYLGR
jgi:uncharacterized protein YbjT (DUF2867 family)